jgi:YVTN family beta-propeller protein
MNAATFGYIANYGGDTVSVVDTATNKVVKTINVGSSPDAVLATPNGAYVYVANYWSNNVSVISTASRSVVKTVGVGQGPTSLAVTPGGGYVYVVDSLSGSVRVIKVATQTDVKVIRVNGSPEGVAITPNGRFAYVSLSGAGGVAVIDTATDAFVKTIATGYTSDPGAVTISPGGGRVYLADSNAGLVIVIGTSTNKVLKTVAVPDGVSAMTLSPRGFLLYIDGAATGGPDGPCGGSMDVMSTSNYAIVGTQGVGCAPGGLAVTPNGEYVYATASGDNALTILRAPGLAVVKYLFTGSEPDAVAMS